MDQDGQTAGTTPDLLATVAHRHQGNLHFRTPAIYTNQLNGTFVHKTESPVLQKHASMLVEVDYAPFHKGWHLYWPLGMSVFKPEAR